MGRIGRHEAKQARAAAKNVTILEAVLADFMTPSKVPKERK